MTIKYTPDLSGTNLSIIRNFAVDSDMYKDYDIFQNFLHHNNKANISAATLKCFRATHFQKELRDKEIFHL